MTKATSTRPHGEKSSALRLAIVYLTLAAVLSGAGCSLLPVPKASQPPMEILSDQPTEDLAAEAEGYWKAGNYPLAELQYSRLLERGDLEPADKLTALDRLAESAFKSRHFHQAKEALDRRAGRDKTVLGAWAWHDLYIRTLASLHRADLLETHQAPRIPQDNSLSSYAPRLKKEHGLIRWDQEVSVIVNQIRGLSPSPCAYTFLDGKTLKIFAARGIEQPVSEKPGQVRSGTKEGLPVTAKNGYVVLKDIQMENRKRMNASDFLRGYELRPDAVLG